MEKSDESEIIDLCNSQNENTKNCWNKLKTSFQAFSTPRRSKRLTEKRRKRQSMPLRMRYSPLSIEVHRSAYIRRIKRRHSTVHVPKCRNGDDDECVTIDWSSSSDECDRSTSLASIKGSNKSAQSNISKTKLSTNHIPKCNRSLNPVNKLCSNVNNTDNDDEDDDRDWNFTIEWSSSDENGNKKNNTKSLPDHHQLQKKDDHGKVRMKNRNISAQKSFQSSMEFTQTQTESNTQTKKNKSERHVVDGYSEQFEEVMRQIRSSRKFLEFDKKYGVRKGMNLRILNVEKSFGVHLATVVTPDNGIVQIVLYPDNAETLVPGNILESFMDSTEPYEIEPRSGIQKVYVQPHQFIPP